MLASRLWTFDANAESWSDPNGTVTFIPLEGSPSPGSIKDVGPDNGTQPQNRTMVWSSWGLPANATVNRVRVSFRWRIELFSDAAPHEMRIRAAIDDGHLTHVVYLRDTDPIVAPSDWFIESSPWFDAFTWTEGATTRFWPIVSIALLNATVPIVGVEARLDTVLFELDFSMPSPPASAVYSGAQQPSYLPLIEGEPDMICRKALLKDYAQYATLTGEKIWAYQLITNYCADWLEVSIGAIIDPNASAGAHVLNGNFGVRVYEGAVGSNNSWLVNTSGAAIGRGIPFVFPAWQSPVLIPWMGKNVNVIVEFVTADTIVAGTVLELSIAPIQEGA